MRRGAAMLTAVAAQIRVFCSVSESAQLPGIACLVLAGPAGRQVSIR